MERAKAGPKAIPSSDRTFSIPLISLILLCFVALSLCFDCCSSTTSNLSQLGRHSRHSASRILVILPSYPIGNGEVRKGGY